MKQYKLTATIIILFCFAALNTYAQEKELVVTYSFDRQVINYKGDNHDEMIMVDLPTYPVRTYASKTGSIRETEPRVSEKYTKDMQFISRDTAYNLVHVDLTKGQIFEPVQSGGDEHGIGYKMLLIEPLNSFQWKLGEDKKVILGYSCYKATCTFRGRDYVAYFTKEIPFKAAPWKFYGLPGVVLEVYSTDGFCKWKANSIKTRTQHGVMTLPYEGLSPFTLDQYIEFLKKQRLEYIDIYEKNALKFPDVQHFKNYLKELKMNLPSSIEIFESE